MATRGVETWLDPRLRLARLATLAAVAGALLTSLILPGVGLWFEQRPLWVVVGALGILAVTGTQAMALYAAVARWSARARQRSVAALAAAAVLSVPLVGPVAAGQWATWAWLGGSIAGTAPMLVRRPVAAVAVGVSIAASAGVALWAGGSPSPGFYALTTGWVGLAVAAMTGLPVWLWRLLVHAEQGRAAQARLAATEERLRFARDVHDLLGHNLAVIALKAELAARLAASDPDRAAEQAAEAQRLAGAALAQTRETVHGYRAVDLSEQVAAVAQVLRSCGVRCTVTQPSDVDLSAEVGSQLAAVLREASTNVMRHSHASWCTIELIQDSKAVRMTVVNDGADGSGPDRHSYGLRGLAERLAGARGELHTHQHDGVFTLEATVPMTPVTP